ncbi:hypothetical protein L3Y34_008582 [Caenorhabditis briggsae]|uniref:receptor protein-tyrosine kinase n=2 Tax=Caenorhabditis briggsae TaxID=6238 RepID=A0AAE9A3F4_CAEBR|nr:hypothetical protein L3Y34_008582 [Caenorhabditis briggsae]
MRKRVLWKEFLILFRISLVTSIPPNETFNLARYYEARLDVQLLDDPKKRTYFIAAETKEEAVNKFSTISSNCSLLSDVEVYSCKEGEKFCDFPNNPTFKTYKFEDECECYVDSCDRDSNSTDSMILYPGCFCEPREMQCDFQGSCPHWTQKSDHDALVFKTWPMKKEKNPQPTFEQFIQAGDEHAVLHRKTVSLYSSKFFRQSGFNCSLNFKHHFTHQSTSSRLVVKALMKNTTKSSKTLYEYTEKREKIAWENAFVAIGSYSEPFKITIDCETGSRKKKNYTEKVFACGLAEIAFEDCADIRNPKEQCSRGDQFLCTTNRNTKCLKDAQCDLKRDCSDGSDEMNCGSVVGTMCNFESPDGFCDGWLQTTRIIGPTQKLFEPTTVAPSNKIEEKPSILLKKRAPSTRIKEARKGSGQMLVYDYLEVQDLSRRRSVLQSPAFPRTNPAAYDHNSPMFETCTLRFYVCSRAYPKTWEIAIISKSGNPFDSGRTVLYEGKYDPNTVATMDSNQPICKWERVLLTVPRQNAGFRLGIFVDNLHMEDVFAIDDLSFSPSCFEKSINESTWEIPDLTISTCGTSGSKQPDTELCKKERELDGQTGHFLKEDGSQEWTVPVEGFYRIDACGAGGGSTSATNGEPGDCITLQVHLMENIALRMIVGQVGESACLIEHEDEFHSTSCSKNSEIARRDNDGGAGGGGATLIKVESDQWNVVIGGGAGASWIDEHEEEIDNAGYGASVIPVDFDEKCNVTCVSVTQTDFLAETRNRCPIDINGEKDYSTVYGGFGGGGISCGILGGGGAGYKAGNPFGKGRERSGTSNVTDNFSKNVLYFQSNKVEEGYIKIKFCRKQCAKPSICRFRKNYYVEEYCACPDGSNFTDTPDACACPLDCPASSTCQYRNFTFEPFCQCNNGKFLDDFSIEFCEESPPWTWYNYVFLMFLIFMIIVSTGIVFYYQKKQKKMSEKLVELKEINKAQADLYQAGFNYTDLVFCGEKREEAVRGLPNISRDEIALGIILGKGHFGEVYYAEIDGIRVAVKKISTAFKTSQAAQADFCNEALCMGTFTHENIVSLIGIDFETVPFMLAIEFMEGGDLLSFVKDSRPNHQSLNPLHLRMADLVAVCRDVAAGCECLEGFKYVHRDIAARNILLTTRGPGRVAKIADFGMAKEIKNDNLYYRVHGRAVLPIKWTPPESFIDGVFTTQSDVWSFGILCWEVFSLGVVPYPNRRNEEVMLMLTEGARLEYPYGIPTKVYRMMRACWRTPPDERPSFKQVVECLREILDDSSSAGMPFPIHPAVRASFAHSQSTPVSVETPMTAITDISLNSTFTDASTVKISTSQQEMQDRMELHEMMLQREKPYTSDMTSCVVDSLRKDLARAEYETGMTSVPQPQYLSPQSIDESEQLIPDSNTVIEQTPPTSLIDLNRLAVQNTGPTLHRPDSLNFNDPYSSSIPLLECQTR